MRKVILFTVLSASFFLLTSCSTMMGIKQGLTGTYPTTTTSYTSSGGSGAVAPIYNKCKCVGYYYINGVKYSCSQCGGLGRDWIPAK